MRRIPRPPLRALEPPRPRASPCRHGGTVCSSAAALSTSATRHFLVPAGKQNKKKHQQFVRRWQKRLLGDSEPIGAHVDPYDPTSPVRIAPEEQGEYEEVLEEAADAVQSRHKSTDPTVPPVYQPATDALRLRCVGDQQWQRRRLEADLAREFEKLTLRTYTPLSLAMASEIEVLTGTPYTLRDENLLMAQMVHHATNRPYTHHNFGVHTKPATPRELKHRFDRAVAEVFARKQAGLDLDMFKLANQGVYDAPRWVQDIKVCLTENGEITLSYPKDKSAEDFLQVMQTVPSLDESVPENDELLVDEATAEDIEAGVEATDPLNSVMPLEQPSTMDPETPAYKRAAVVKADTEKKPFDFMSNRPTPRAKPVEEPKSSEVVETEVLIDNHESTTMSSVPEAASPPTTPESISQASISSTPSTTEDSLHCPVDNDANANTGAETLTATDPDTCLDVPAVKMAKWRGVPITDVALKFALFKRLLQLTSIRIPDPQLSASKTLGDLYGYFRAAATPQPAGLFSAIHVEGQKAREKAKQRPDGKTAPRRKADLGDLINLGNVEIRRTQPNKIEKNTKIGRNKVVQYALWERGLTAQRHNKAMQKGRRKPKRVVQVPDFGRPLSNEGAAYLAKINSEAKKSGRKNVS